MQAWKVLNTDPDGDGGKAPASYMPAEGRQEEARKCAGGAEKGHEERDPDAAGGGDWQGPDQGAGEVRGAGIGGTPQEETLITARPRAEMQSKVLSSDSNRNTSSPQGPGYDPAAFIHEKNFKEEALIKANRRSVHSGQKSKRVVGRVGFDN